MLKKIASLVAYKKVPRTTFLFKNRKKGVKALASWKGAKMAAKSPIGKAVGAALAIPVAVMTYRKVADSA